MNYGLYVTASGISTAMARQDILSNNLANVNTVGFKPMMSAVRARDVVRVEDALPFADSDAMLERLGAGVMPTATRRSGAQGALERTDRPLDVALEGKGFLVAERGAGREGLRLTRDGRLALNGAGELVTAAGGEPVLGVGNARITLDASLPIEIRGDGAVAQRGAVVARLRVADVDEPSRLAPDGGGMLRAPRGELLELRDGAARVVQGAVEKSAVNPISTMMAVQGASRRAQGGFRMISTIDETMRMAIARLGRVG